MSEGWIVAGAVYLWAWYGVTFATIRHGRTIGLPPVPAWAIALILVPWPAWLMWFALKGSRP